MDAATKRRLVREMSRKMRLTPEQYEEFKALCDDLDLEPVNEEAWKRADNGEGFSYLSRD